MGRMRIRKRFRLLLPVRIFVRRILSGLGVSKRRTVLVEETVTENISSVGCYVFLSHEPEVGSKVRMQIAMRNKDAATSGKILCRGSVVRVEKGSPNGKIGVACTIDHYRLVAAQNSATKPNSTPRNLIGA